MAHRLGRLQSDIHYCYQCFDWVIGEEWEPHCQEHLAAPRSKQCGTVTYCHTLVRPAYCPLCHGEPRLPASQQLKPRSRDHKLWCHINDEHLVDRRWPLVRRLCDVPLKDAAAFQCHFADEHELTRIRPVKPAISAALDSQDEKMPLDKEAPGAGTSRKRKCSSDTKPLQWMPPQSLDSASTSSVERLVHRPQKRPRPTPPVICPTALSLDEAFSDDRSAYRVTDSVMLVPHYTLSIEDDESCAGLECDLFPSQCATLSDAIDPIVPADLDDVMFDHYLRSPTSSPSPILLTDNVASELSGATLIDSERDKRSGSEEPLKELSRVEPRSPGPEHETEKQEAGYQEDIMHLNSGPRIRLRVSRPQITLRLKLPATRQDGMRANRRGKTKTETKRKGIQREKRKNEVKKERAKKGKSRIKSERTKR